MADGAIFHLDVTTISRSQGRSSVAAAAYRAAERLLDTRTGLEHDYRRKQGVIDSYIAAPDECDWINHRQALWDAAEAAEKRKNSTVAREWLVALPDALDAVQRADLVRALATELVTRYGVVVDVAIHAPNRKGDKRNHHAHLLCTTRKAEADGFGAKTRILDAAKTGGVEIAEMRAWWAGMINDALKAADSDARVDHRRKSVIVAEMQAAADALRKQAANIDALNVPMRDLDGMSGFAKATRQAFLAAAKGGVSAVISKASDAKDIRKQADDLDRLAADIEDAGVGTHDGPQLTAYKRRMAKAWEAEAKAAEAIRAAKQVERERREALEREKARKAEEDRQNALRAAEKARRLADARELYVKDTSPLIAKARQTRELADEIREWGIDLNRPDYDVARDDVWRAKAEGHFGKLVWEIVYDFAKELEEERKLETERQRLSDVEAFMQAQVERASTFPTPSQKWKYPGFKALEPDSIQTAFRSKYRAKLTTEEITTTIRKMLTRWVERIVEDIGSIKQGLSSVWLALTGGHADAAKALAQAVSDHDDIAKPLIDALPSRQNPEKQQKPEVPPPSSGPSGPG